MLSVLLLHLAFLPFPLSDTLLTSGKLYEHLAEIDTSARDMAEYLIKEMAKKQGVTEELKAADMMRWIGLMNNIRACADEIVLNDIVYS